MSDRERIEDAFATLRKRHGVSARDHLGFGVTDKQVGTYEYTNGKWFGELNSGGKSHGKGVTIFTESRNIIFGYDENGKWKEGSYLTISRSGQI